MSIWTITFDTFELETNFRYRFIYIRNAILKYQGHLVKVMFRIITTRKRSLGQGNIFAPVFHSVHRGVSIPACISGSIPACLTAGLRGVVSQHALQVSRPTPKGEVEGDLAMGGGSRPTPKGEVEGNLAWGSPGPHPRGKLRGIWPWGGGFQAHTQGGS